MARKTKPAVLPDSSGNSAENVVLGQAAPGILQTSIVLAAVNAVSTQVPVLVSQIDKVIQCNIPAGFTGVTLRAEGSNDGGNWDLLNSFTASGAVTNTDPYRFLRSDITALSGGGATGANIPVAKKLNDTNLTGGALSVNEIGFYRNNGTVYVLTSTAFTIGEWLLFSDFTTSTEWSGLNLPVIDEGTTQALIYDHGSVLTNANNLQDGTLDIISAVVSCTVGQ